jgi:hypothetical protein
MAAYYILLLDSTTASGLLSADMSRSECAFVGYASTGIFVINLKYYKD